MNYKLPLLYKKLLILSIVFGPIIWLMFTEDGQRRSDTVVLWLFGEHEIKMDLAKLEDRLTENELRQVYPDLDWQCRNEQSTYGSRFCASRLGIFNGMPSKYISFFFQGDQLSAMKLNYRDNNHEALQMQIGQQLGQPEPGSSTPLGAPTPDEVLHWRTLTGAVIMKRELMEKDEPSLFWLSNGLLAN